MNLKRSMAYLRLHVTSFMRSKSGIFFVVLLPVIFMVIFGAIFGNTSTQKTTLAVQDMDQSPLTAQMLAAINSTGLFALQMIPLDQNLTSYMVYNSVDQGIKIPSNFSSGLKSGKTFVSYYSNPADPYSQSLSLVLQNILFRFGNNGTSAIYLTNIPVAQNIPKSVDYYLPGLIGFTMLNGIFSMIYIVPNYTEKKIFRQLSFTGLTKLEWLFAVIVFYMGITLLSDAVLIIVGVTFFGINLAVSGIGIILVVLSIFIGLITFVSIGLLAGLLTKKEETASLIGNVIFFPMMFLSGVFFPISIMPGYLQAISSVLPLTYFIKILDDILLFSSISLALPHIIYMGIFAIVLFAASVYAAARKEDA
jgi:ABC-2 type transport system permease protein